MNDKLVSENNNRVISLLSKINILQTQLPSKTIFIINPYISNELANRNSALSANQEGNNITTYKSDKIQNIMLNS